MNDLTDFDKLQAEITLFVSPVTQITVTDLASNEVARDTLKKIVTLKRMIEAKRVETVKPLNERVKEINVYAGKIEQPLLDAEKFVKGRMGEFAAAEAERRIKEQQRLQAEARERERLAAIERQRIEAEAKAKREAEEKKAREDAEAKRLEMERIAKEEADALAEFGVNDPEAEELAAQEAEAARLAAAEEQRKLTERLERDRLEQEARFQREAEERERARRADEKALEASRPKNTRQVPKYRVKDLDQVPRAYLVLNESMVKQAQAAGIEIPGVEYYFETTIVAR